MNIIQADLLLSLMLNNTASQRAITNATGYSLGSVNNAVRILQGDNYIDNDYRLTDKAVSKIQAASAKRAIILAAGYGLRILPINKEVPKGLLKVHGECLIERLIKQLHEVEITEIYVVVGFQKEKYEYLIDKFQVKLIVNPQYVRKNNIYSLNCAREYLSNCYIMPCDVWCRENPFSACELYSWYMVGEQDDNESTVRVNRKKELVKIKNEEPGNAMLGIAYLTENTAAIIRSSIEKLCQARKSGQLFWEHALFNGGKTAVMAKIMPVGEVYDINTYEDLRALDETSENLFTSMITQIANILEASPSDIQKIQPMKKGMTNHSCQVTCKNKRYIVRMPGEGTQKLINRQNEYNVYKAVNPLQITDTVVFMDPHTGLKLTEYISDAHVCDPQNSEEVRKCMQILRRFHETGLTVPHTFDLFGQIQMYEELRGDTPSLYSDYSEIKRNVMQLKRYIDAQPKDWVLTHIDAVPDNFLFSSTQDGIERITLIDWEYAGMQDPHVDIAMFAIYALYPREQVDALIDAYFPEGCSSDVRIKIYCYIATCGLLWSNWCEFKRILGIEFGEYSLMQYRFAKEYAKLVQKIREI